MCGICRCRVAGAAARSSAGRRETGRTRALRSRVTARSPSATGHSNARRRPATRRGHRPTSRNRIAGRLPGRRAQADQGRRPDRDRRAPTHRARRPVARPSSASRAGREVSERRPRHRGEPTSATPSPARRGQSGWAWRTARRWTPWRRAIARMDSPSSRWSRRIRSNCSTLDNSHSRMLRTFDSQRAYGAVMGPGGGASSEHHFTLRGGARSERHSHPAYEMSLTLDEERPGVGRGTRRAWLCRPRGGRKPRFDHATGPWFSWTSPPEQVPPADIARVDRDQLPGHSQR